MSQNELIKQLLEACKDLTLLYVEDDLQLSQATYEMLLPFFKEICQCHDGLEGLNAYKDSSYDIILTDIMMPNLDGKEMSKQIREINPEQPIVVMSAYEDAEYLRELIQIGIQNFITKPASIERLFGVILSSAININNAKQVAKLSLETKQDLAQNKAILRTIIDNVPVRIFWKDKDSIYLGCNKLFAKDAGCEDESELIGKSDFELPWKDEAQGYVNDDEKVIKSGKEYLSYEEEQTQEDGKHIWLTTSKTPLLNHENEVVGIIGTYVDITQQKEALFEVQKAKDALGYQAEHDDLTGLPNRILFLDRLNQAIKQSKRNSTKAAVIFLDLDRFKDINDTFGHDMGDKVVQLLAERLEEHLRKVDTIARFGGDEFIILVESIKDMVDVIEILEKLIKSMEIPFVVEEHSLHLTLSAGVSIFPDDGDNSEILIRNADTAMYRAKDDGRNTYHFYTKEMTEKSLQHIVMSKNIRKGLENNEFVVFYQPQINAKTNTFLGMEALVRWKNEDNEIIAPADFIPIAEECGLIDKIGQLVFKEAVTQITQWYKKGYQPGRVAINLSIIELQQENFVKSIHQTLQEVGCKPEWIELEITEGYTMKHPEQAIKMLQEIKDLGIHLSIDDFGTGYSSLSYLKRLPVHKLKIDQSFIQGLPENKDDKAIVKTIISLAHTMNFELIAEGVETTKQESFLMQENCDNIQGYLHSKPMPAQEMEKFFLNFAK